MPSAARRSRLGVGIPRFSPPPEAPASPQPKSSDRTKMIFGFCTGACAKAKWVPAERAVASTVTHAQRPTLELFELLSITNYLQRAWFALNLLWLVLPLRLRAVRRHVLRFG